MYNLYFDNDKGKSLWISLSNRLQQEPQVLELYYRFLYSQNPNPFHEFIKLASPLIFFFYRVQEKVVYFSG